MFGDVSLSDTEFVFTDGTVIDLNGNDFTFGEGSTITIIMEQLGTEVVMLAATNTDYTIQGRSSAAAASFLAEARPLTARAGAKRERRNSATIMP